MSKLLLDTDILIDLLRGRHATRRFLAQVTQQAVPCCSVISVAELAAGLRAGEESATEALVNALVVVPVSRQIAEVAGRFKRTIRRQTLELADCLIAATAFVESATLVTGNVKDYPMSEVQVMRGR